MLKYLTCSWFWRHKSENFSKLYHMVWAMCMCYPWVFQAECSDIFLISWVTFLAKGFVLRSYLSDFYMDWKGFLFLEICFYYLTQLKINALMLVKTKAGAVKRWRMRINTHSKVTFITNKGDQWNTLGWWISGALHRENKSSPSIRYRPNIPV